MSAEIAVITFIALIIGLLLEGVGWLLNRQDARPVRLPTQVDRDAIIAALEHDTLHQILGPDDDCAACNPPVITDFLLRNDATPGGVLHIHDWHEARSGGNGEIMKVWCDCGLTLPHQPPRHSNIVRIRR